MQHSFTALLLNWNHSLNKREMPWKGEKDPYKIWLSEIILQQTRVEQGLSYYLKFVELFPDVFSLAAAPEAKVMKTWEGLGYYSRCRNLIYTAKFIVNDLGGKFPADYEGLLNLKGVGPYTAAAISSFAFNLPYAVVDGNVFRVLSRIFANSTPIDSTTGKKYFTELANELVDQKEPGQYNQAIMDFGATICTPAPKCNICPMTKICKAFQQDIVTHFPVKEKILKKKDRWMTMFVLRTDDKIFVKQRIAKDIWLQLFEFYTEETEKAVKWKPIEVQSLFKERYALDIVASTRIDNLKQQLTHQTIHSEFIEVRIQKIPAPLNRAFFPITELSGFAFPRIINEFLERHPVL
jgi:A/G-specific adenine glycosylase